MSKQTWHKEYAPSLPPKGTRVILHGDPNSPVMSVARHTQFDNGEVECIWFTLGQEPRRAWLPASLLRTYTEPRVPYRPAWPDHLPKPSKDWRRFMPRSFA